MAKTAQEKADLKAEKLYEKTHKKKYRTRPGDMLFNLINYLIFILFTVACIFPFYYLFINTISDNDLVVKGVINFIPRGLHLDNYKSLLNVSDLSNAFLVSVGRTLLGTAFMVAASAFVGYLVTKQEMWGRKFWYRFFNHNHVLQRRPDSLVLKYADAGPDEYLLGLHHSRNRCPLQYYSGKKPILSPFRQSWKKAHRLTARPIW